MVGVNVAKHDSKTLEEIMDREQLGWRSLADPGGTTAAWHLSGTPTFYLIDHAGLIRHKWVGGPGASVIDAAVEQLVEEAERAR